METASTEAIEQILSHWAGERIRNVFPAADLSSVALNVVPTMEEKFGDYQCNACMALAKQIKQSPRAVAQAVVQGATLPPAVESIEIAGPGFLNFKLKAEWLGRRLEQMLADDRLGTQASGRDRTVVIDYSSPNVAKPMHIGHIRSTVIGNALDRLHRFLGYRVIADNHVGDWGTQFGILLLGWKRDRNEAALKADPIAELERIYKTTNAVCDGDGEERERARQELVKLQQGDPENLKIWETMQQVSQAQFDEVYQRLGVNFDVTLGESFYNPRLSGVVEDLLAQGVARETLGAIGVFSAGGLPEKEDAFLINKDGEWTDNPCLVRKSDGGFNYATTDLATLVYRLETWSPEAIFYVTDGRQQLHFRQIFATFRRWKPAAHVKLEHIWFGTILGADGKPFKTRSGDTVKLLDLLNEAEERAYAMVTEKSPDMEEATRRTIARTVGLGAIKYADLMSNRQNDYVFNWDKMLSLEGNTAPYLQYAYARIASVRDKYRERFPDVQLEAWPIQVIEPIERRLATRLVRFPDVVTDAAAACKPNMLCDYLFELAQTYSSFYQNVPFLKADEGIRESRVRMCDLVARTIKTGLGLLGIETLERI
jgi:arginyl-tRNA synthetase